MGLSCQTARLCVAVAFCFVCVRTNLCAAESAAKLAEKLASTDREARRDAAFELSKLGAEAKDALPALIKALDDPDKQVWSDAVTAIANLGPAAKDAIPALLDDMVSRRGRGMRERDRRQALVRSAYALSRIGPAALPELITALSSDDNSLRQGAAKAVAGMGKQANAAIPALKNNLAHSDAEVRREVIDAFARMGEDSVNPLIDALTANEPLARQSALLALTELGSAAHAAAPRLLELSTSEKDPAVRAALLGSFAKIGVDPARAIPLLVSALKENDENVRHGATNALLLLRDGRALAVPLLAEVVRTADPLATPRAAAILGRYGAAAVDAVPALISLIESQNPSAAACSDALVQIGPAAAPGILHAVDGKDPNQLAREHWSVRALAAMGGAALSSIAQGFSSVSVSARLVAVRACGELGLDGNAAGASVLKLCEDSDPRVRTAALGSAAAVRVDPKQLQARLEVAFKDPIPIVRMTAVQVVQSLGENGRVFAPALIAALKDDTAMVRQAALLAIGPGQPEAVPVLVETLSNPAMRDEVLAALGKLAAAAAPAVPHLVALYPQVEKPQRLAILDIISQSGASETPPLFSEAIKDPDPDIRAAAITGFVRAQSDKTAAANAAVAMLSDAEQPVRRAAAAALGRLGESARNPATEPLIALLERDGDREFALDALRQLRIRSVATIVALLDHRDERVRVFACERLARAGADAREAIPTLQKLAQSDAQPDAVRREARRALAQIERR